MSSMRASPIGVSFTIVRVLQLLAVLSTIPPLSLFAARTSRNQTPAPYQLIFALAIVTLPRLSAPPPPALRPPPLPLQ